MTKADLVIKNGEVYTVDSNRSVEQAVAVMGDKIVYVGDDRGAEAFVGENTEVIDANGKMILPGFIEAHAHPVLGSYYGTGFFVDMEAGLDEVLETVRTYIKENPDLPSYFGLGYLETLFGEEGPKKELLDEVCSDKPIFFVSSTGHEAWVNSKALEMAGIDKNTPDPLPGFQYFKRDKDGNPTGRLFEADPQIMVMEKIHPFNNATEVIDGTLAGYSSVGVTSIMDAGAMEVMEEEGYGYMDEKRKAGNLPCRIFGCKIILTPTMISAGLDGLKELNRKYHNDQMWFNTYKIIDDGTIESRTAAFRDPYTDTGTTPETLFSTEEMKKKALELAEAGFDLHVHSVGDKGVTDVLMAAKAVREKGYKDMRITVAHVNYIIPEQRELFGKYDVILTTSGGFFAYRDEWVTALGEREKDQFSVKTVLKDGGKVTLGSDFPVDEVGFEPMKAIEMVVTRQPFGEKDTRILEPATEKLTIEEAIEAYTINGAYQVHMEDKLGSIEVGKYADLVILEESPFKVDTHEIHKIAVEKTIANGKVVYAA